MIKIAAIRGNVLGVAVYRGYARLCDLARVSKPDVYDREQNPSGTQRDLSPKHAREAYEYVKSNELAFWPEVFLCARDSRAIKFTPSDKNTGYGMLAIDDEKIEKSSQIVISRVDGNHRLHYADGKSPGFPELTRKVSFCLATDLSLDEEIQLFRDINNNQKRMNTSHLDNITIRLTRQPMLKKEDPDLYITKRLADDSNSPFHGMIYDGGKKIAGSPIPLRTLKTGIEYMRSRPTKLTALGDADAQYRVIRNYFIAVKDWVPGAWKKYKEYLVLRGAGLWGICFIGAEVIDRVLSKGRFDSKDMGSILRSGKTWDWSNDGDFKGYSGRGGAVEISDKVVSEFRPDGALSISDLYKKIMRE